MFFLNSHLGILGQESGGVGIDSIGQVNNPNHKRSIKRDIVGIVVPSAMITYGLVSLGDNCIRQIDYKVQRSLVKNNQLWDNHADDFVQFAPAAAAFTMKLCQVESKNTLLDMGILYGLSNLLAGGIVQGGKMVTGRVRPNNVGTSSFPSGHTETAFVAAEFLYQEYKDQSVWISVGGYGAAVFVGISRVYNNKHWVSDVVTGAGIGILSTKAVYWLYPHLKKTIWKKSKSSQTFVLPQYSGDQIGLILSHTF